MNRKSTISLILTVLLLLAAFEGALAGSVSAGGITLSWPNYPLTGPALLSCEPWLEPTANTINLTNVPAGSTVLVNFTWANPYTGAPNYLPPIYYYRCNGKSRTGKKAAKTRADASKTGNIRIVAVVEAVGKWKIAQRYPLSHSLFAG